MALVTPDDGQPLLLAQVFRVDSAGAESNVAAGLAALGHRAAWVSRLGADALGDRVHTQLGAAGVDVSFVDRTEAPTGLFVKDPRPEGSRVLYYRTGSAASTMGPDLLPRLAGLQPRVVHLSGVTPALSPSCAALVRGILQDRPFGSALVSFDVNHRPGLWDPATAGPVLEAFGRLADVVFVGADEAAAVWGDTSLEAVRARYPDARHLVVKDGPWEATEFGNGGSVSEPAPSVVVHEPVGAGDAFAAGWLSGFLRGLDVVGRLRLGHLMAASTLVSAGDLGAVPAPDTVSRFLTRPTGSWAATGEGPWA